MTREFIEPGHVEVFCGPMKSGKSEAVIYRLTRLMLVSESGMLIVKPDTDTRDPFLRSRAYKVEYPCTFASYKNPAEILSLLEDRHKVLIIDEAQFFTKGIERVVEEVSARNLHTLVSGLDLDFRGEPFGRMPQLLSLADQVHKLAAVCDSCKGVATRTQRIINNRPAPYDSPLVLIGDSESYQPRCLRHHDVPGRAW